MSQSCLVGLIVAAMALLLPFSAGAADTEVITLTGHTGTVTSVAFSPEGTKVLTGSDDQTAILWDPVYAAPLLTYTGHAGPVNSVAFSADGTKLLTGSDDRTAKLWDPIFGFCLHTFTGHTGSVNSAAFSADGTKLFTGSDDQTAILWDVVYRTATRTFTGHTQPISSVAVTADKTKLLTGSLDNSAVLWNAVSGAVTKTFSGHTEAVHSVAFSPDGTRVLTGSADDTAILWDASTGALIQTFTGHTSDVTSVAFSPGGAKILTGSNDKTAILWEASTGTSISTFAGHTGAVTSVAFSPDGTQVLTGSADNTAKLWPLTVSVPDVTDQNQTAAENTLTGAYLALGTVTGQCSDAVVVGLAVSQDPAAGQKVAFGSAVNVTLSTGMCDVLVPGVVGQTQAAASTALTDARLAVGTITEQYGTTVLLGSVISQTPPEGDSVAPGTAVDLVVSSGPYHIMPNLAGLDQAAAATALAAVGMTIGTVNLEGSNTAPAGTVMNQYPVAETPTPSGTVVKLAISSGRSNVSVISNQFGYGVLSSNVVYSPDGTLFLTGSGDGNARTWDSTTGLETHIYGSHAGRVNAVAFSPDGSKVLTGSDDSTAKLWDAVTQAELVTFTGHGARVSSVVFSPDGTKVLTGSYDYTAKLWDAATGAEIRTFTGHTGIVTVVAYSPDGTQVLTGAADTAILWDAAAGTEISTFAGPVNSVSFSHDGTRILTDGALWDIASGVAVVKFQTTSQGDRTVSSALSPDDTVILTVTDKGRIYLYPVIGGEGGGWTESINLFQDFVATFSPDGTNVLAVTWRDNNLKLWDIAAAELRVFSGYTAAVNSAALSPDGTTVFTGSAYAATLWDRATNAEIHNFDALDYSMGLVTQHYGMNSVAYSPDGTGLLAGSEDGIARLLDAVSGAKLQTFTGHSAAVTSVAFSPDGTNTLTGSRDGTAKLWDATSGQAVQTFTGHANAVTSVAYAPDGSAVLTGSADQTAILWDASTGMAIQTFAGNTSTVTSVAFSPDQTTLLTGQEDATATLWDNASGTVIRTFAGHSSAITSVAYSPNGATVLTGSLDNTARLWDAKSGTQIGTLAEHRSAVLSVSFSLDGTKALTGSGDGTARLWPLTLVPDVVGQSQEDVPPVFTAVGLAAGTITEVYSTTVPAGKVISQSSGAGTSVNPGSAIALTVSKGTHVPDVMGQPQATALTAITNAGLAAGAITEEFSVTAAIGNVIGQSPEPDTVVNPGTAVALTVSKGTPVPDVAGQTQAAAAAAITGAGLAVGAITQQYGTTVAWGHVISQSPVPAVCLDPGTTVALVISSGPYNVTPNVVGQTQAAATTAITGVGLIVGEITQEYSPTVPAGNVIIQSPMAGTVVNPGTAVAITLSKGTQPVPAPNVVGLTQAAASTAITNAGLTVGTITEEYSPTVPSGGVISQAPTAGTLVSPGTAVAVILSKGPQPVTVPNVVGQSQAAASTAISAATLTVGTITEEFSSTIPSGIVTSQSPVAGTAVNPGSAVALTVSKGPQPVTVPDVVGQTQAAASTAVTAVGLTVGTITEAYSSTVASGNVISQSLEADSSVSPGTVVALTVSKGPQPVSVPDVVGQTQAAASTAIADVGLTVGAITEEYSSTVPSGNVIRQSPVADSPVSPGTVVALTVSKGPQPVTVPNVAGQTQAAASTAITGVGLTVGTITQEFSSTVASGNVVSQSPAADSPVNPGTVVDLIVSRGPQPLITVPDVTGQAQAVADATLTGADFTNGTATQQCSDTVAEGLVVSQNPVAGEMALFGSVVTLTISTGKCDLLVPGVVGQTQAAASATVAGAGLMVGAITQQFGTAMPFGSVISQSPSAGDLAAPGSAVALVVSTGPYGVTPDVGGQTQAAASMAITGVGLAVGTITLEYSSTAPSGQVINQSPAAGTSVGLGTAVALTVSKGPQPVTTVPDLTGQTQTEASAAITGAGLTVGAITQEYSSTVPLGQVAGQSPAAGTSVSPGTAVALTLSKGPQPVTVPNVAGQTQAAASAAIIAAGLTVGAVTQEYSSTAPTGQVTSQSPAAGTLVGPGTAVALTLSKGPQPVTVPNVAGQTQANASTAIIAAGLTIGTVMQEYSSTAASGIVTSQSPAAGISVSPGTAVALTLSKGPQPVTVPNVAGQTQADASTAIIAVGLTIGTVMQEYSSTVASGTVVSQFPVAGTLVSPGAVVALTASKGPQPATVPNLVNQTQTAATMALTGANLSIGTVTQQCNDTVAAGLVVSQSPAAGLQMVSGSAVALTVSTGLCTVPEPAESAFRDLLAQSLNTLDGNGDAQVSYAEALAALPGLTQALFNTVDADGDGQISRNEAGLDQSGPSGCSGCSGCSGGKGSFSINEIKKAFGNLFSAGASLGTLH